MQNRLIKFRAWDIDNKIMRYFPSQGICELGNWYINFKGEVWERHGEETGGDFLVDGIVLMQYSGLKDRHEKEIYEGDILKSQRKGNYVVKWDGGGWKLIQITNGKIWKNYKTTAATSLEIIGNIFEHPELLKQ